MITSLWFWLVTTILVAVGVVSFTLFLRYIVRDTRPDKLDTALFGPDSDL